MSAALAEVLEAEAISLEERAVLAARRGPARAIVTAHDRDDGRIPRPDVDSASDGSAA